VPQTGVLGTSTRNAIQTFQTQHQLPASGYLDPGTISALQAACSGAAPVAGPPPAPAAEPPEAAAAPPPDAAPADAPPASELSFEMRAVGPEWIVNGPFAVDLDIHQPVPANSASQLAAIPNAPGVYIVFHGATPWYVGIAEKNLKERIPSALKTAGSFVSWASIRSARASRAGMRLVQPGKPPETVTDGTKAILKMLQQILVRKHGTHNRGNRNSGVLRFTGAGQFEIHEKGRRVAHFASGQSIDTRGN
jgi:peptidoglycan hydrolase-like protein with peptidoglycan-binding domain